ncbi:MAG: TIM44-like domain-containing protein [Betaproteobacteria bacterium]
MKFFFVGIVIALTSTCLLMPDADARPLGGKRSIGMKRDSVQQNTATPPSQGAVTPAKPVSPAAVPAAAAPAPSGMSKWLGPLAGFAAGGLLASLFMGGGFGGLKMFDILLFAGLAFGAFMIWRAMSRRKEAAAGAGPLQYAGAGNAGATPVSYSPASPAPAPSGGVVTPEIGSRLADGHASTATIDAATAAPRIPADFEVEPFLRQGRVAFIRLQAANDRRDLNDIRDFTTPEMYAELAMQIQERGNVEQRTEIVSMDTRLLEVVTEAEGKNRRMIASVRFTGQFKDGVNAPVESLDEVWHVTKQLDEPQSTWLLAGIQQVE